MASDGKGLPKPRHILDLTPEEKREFIQSIDLIFSDIDGVLWNFMARIDGVAEGFNALSRAGKKYYFISNNSVRSEEAYDKDLKACGFDEASVHNILTEFIHPAKSIANYLININFDGLIYCIGSDSFKTVLRKAGFRIIDGPNKILKDTFSDLARNVFDKEPVRAVVMDVDINLSGAKIIRAEQYLKHPDCIFIAGATDLVLPVSKDIQIIGPGHYVKILAESSGRTPILLGKPGNVLADMLVEKYNIQNRSRTLMIGDMLEQDIGFGKVAGFTTLLVLSGGCSKEEMMKNTNPNNHPDYYADSVRDFVKLFEAAKL